MTVDKGAILAICLVTKSGRLGGPGCSTRILGPRLFRDASLKAQAPDWPTGSNRGSLIRSSCILRSDST